MFSIRTTRRKTLVGRKGELKPGAHLLGLDVAKAKRVSQAPVREALERLKQEGLLIRKANRSAVVSDISLKEIEDIYAPRELIEGYVKASEASRKHMKEVWWRMKKNRRRRPEGMNPPPIFFEDSSIRIRRKTAIRTILANAGCASTAALTDGRPTVGCGSSIRSACRHRPRPECR